MKTLLTLQGGYPRQQDYLLNLQAEMLAMGNSMFGSISFDVVLQGCAVTNNNDGTVTIAAGIVYINGQVLRFDGASNINADGSQAIVTGSPVASGPLAFFDGFTKNVYSEVKAVCAAKAISSARQLIVGVTLLTFEAYIDLRIAGAAQKGTIREFIFETDPEIAAFLAKFDDTGLGITPDMIDWQIMNGNNGPDATGRVSIGVGTIVDPGTGIDFVVNCGDIGGEISHKLVIAEMPSHSHSTPAVFDTGGGSGPHPITTTAISRANQQLAIGNTGGDGYHNNMQPWIGVFKVRKFK